MFLSCFRPNCMKFLWSTKKCLTAVFSNNVAIYYQYIINILSVLFHSFICATAVVLLLTLAVDPGRPTGQRRRRSRQTGEAACPARVGMEVVVEAPIHAPINDLLVLIGMKHPVDFFSQFMQRLHDHLEETGLG